MKKFDMMCLVALLCGLAVCVCQWWPRPGRTKGEVERAILLQARRQGRLVVQEVQFKDLAFLKYTPSVIDKVTNLFNRKSGAGRRVETLWEHRGTIPYGVDLQDIELHSVAGADGTVARVVVRLPPPSCDRDCLKINLEGFRCLKTNCAIQTVKDVYLDLESVAKNQLRGDMEAMAGDDTLKRQARDAARCVLAGFFGGMVPGVDVEVRFSDEAPLPDGLVPAG